VRKILLLFCIAFFVVQAEAQTDVENFYLKSKSNSNTGMYVLGSWALLNMATGAWLCQPKPEVPNIFTR